MGSKIKILIAEDEAISALSMETALSMAGFDVCGWAATGEEAVKMSRQENPDLIIMDVILNGDVNGLEATEEIRSSSDVPILFITGYDEERLLEQIKTFESTTFLIKPITPGVLISAIEEALSQ